MKKYIVLLPFFGKLPPYFYLFLESIARNPAVNFVFFCDQNVDAEFRVPANVRLIKTTLAQIKRDFENKLGFPISLEKPYKICDFRPAFGFLFEDIIKGYDYWGFGDIDLIYGNLGDYLKSKEVEDYSVISFREKWVSGSLAFFRNSDKINSLFQKSPLWQDIFSQPKHFGFDEVLKRHKEYHKANSIDSVNPKDNSFTSLIVNDPSMAGEKVLFSGAVKEWIAPGEILEVNTKTNTIKSLLVDKDFPYYHFVREKNKKYFIYPKWKKVPTVYFISVFGFSKKIKGGRHFIQKSFGQILKSSLEAFHRFKKYVKTLGLAQ